MIAENLLKKLSFTDEMQENYASFSKIYGDRITPWSSAYMDGTLSLMEAAALIRALEPEICTHTADLMLILDCTGYLWEMYQKEGIPESVFLDSMADILCKVRECEKVKGCFGTFVIEWYDGFFRMTRFALGRLQYDVTAWQENDLQIGTYLLKTGDFCVNCHIPSRGPLHRGDCLRSYRLAYDFFRDRLNSGILPIRCSSWLLYPPYREVFGDGSNILEFVKDFRLYGVQKTEQFDDAWRVFSVDYTGNADVLPTDTRLRRSFVSYIRGGGSFGSGKGVILFDGKQVMTKE